MKAGRLPLACTACIALLSSTVLALNPGVRLSQYGHAQWRVREGEFPAVPIAFAQTSDGFVWIGTVDGLFRFDGVRFTEWVPPKGQALPSPIITSLLEARDGSLWIGTMAGVVRWKNQRLTSYSPIVDAVRSIVEDRRGTIWVGLVGTGDLPEPLCEIAETVRCHGDEDGIPPAKIGALVIDALDTLWLGTEKAVIRWHPGSVATPYPVRALTSNTGMSGVMDLALSGHERVWVGMAVAGPNTGLQQLNEGHWKAVTAAGFDGPSLQVQGVLLDRHGALWVGTQDQGLFRIHDGVADHFGRTDGLSSDNVARMFEDRDGNVWVATTGGVDSFRDLKVISYSRTEGTGGNELYGLLARRDGTIWVSGPGTLAVVDRDVAHPVLTGARLPGRLVTSLFEDHEGRLWIGVDDTLSIYEHGRFRRIDMPNGEPVGMAGSIVEDDAHDIWVAVRGARHTLLRIHDLSVREEFPPPAVPAARTLAVDPNGGLWLGLLDGDLAHFRNGTAETFHYPHGPVSRVDQLAIDRSGAVLGATPFGVIGRSRGQQRTLTARNGLPCDAVGALVFDERGSLWLDTHCGLIRISAADVQRWWSDGDARVSVRRLDAFDGVQQSHASFVPSARGQDGRLWFVTGDALEVVDPQQAFDAHSLPPTYIDAVTFGGTRHAPTSDLLVPPLTRDIEIDYTAPSFAAPQRIRFRYALEGRDAGWQEAGARRQAIYTDLRPGSYRFKVMAGDDDGVWNGDVATLAFTVAPAWYQTRTFLLLSIVSAAIAISAGYRLRVRSIASTFRAQFDQRLAERTRMARELHDTFVQTIQASKLVADDALEHPGDTAYADRALQRLSQWLDRAVQESRAALHSLRASTTQVNDLAEAFRRATSEDLKPSSMAISFSVVGDSKAIHPIVRDEVYRIGYEAIRNAIAHSAASRLDVELRYEKDLTVRVTDNGVGIDPLVARAGKDGHFGLQNMRERAGRIGARLEVLSSAAGTTVMLIVPGGLLTRSEATPTS